MDRFKEINTCSVKTRYKYYVVMNSKHMKHKYRTSTKITYFGMQLTTTNNGNYHGIRL